MKLSIIVAAANDNAIGDNGDLIWHISADLKRFKSLTMGHPVIMGRKTWESLPKGALPGRRNIVISRNATFNAPGAEVVGSVEAALMLCREEEEAFIIGGAQIYRQALPLAERLYLTRVDAAYPDADARFPQINSEEWIVAADEPQTPKADEPPYRFIDLVRKQK